MTFCQKPSKRPIASGTATVLNGGWAETVSVENGGLYLLNSGASTHDTRISGGGSARVGRDVIATGMTVLDGGILHVDPAGYARAPIVSSGGTVHVSSAGIIDEAQIYGSVFVSSGGNFNSSTVGPGAEMTVASGGICSQVQVHGGTLSMESGALVRGTVVDSGGQFTLLGPNEIGGATTSGSSGGARETTVNSDGTMTISSGGTANGTTINSSGCFAISNGGTANSTTIAGGRMSVVDGGTAINTIFNGGTLDISGWQSILHDTTVNGGEFSVCNHGTADGVTINADGSLLCTDFGILTGRMTFESGATVSMAEAFLDFDLTRAGEAALVNDLSIIQGTPLYTLTVDGTPADGIYGLADGAAGFGSTISVVNIAGDELGTLAVGETATIGAADYTLNLNGSTLSVTVAEHDLTPKNLIGTMDRVSWDPNGAEQYVVEYSTDDFEHAIRATASAPAIDMLALPAGTYQWRVRTCADVSEWTVGEDIVSDNDPETPKVLQSNEDGCGDLFFDSADGTWGSMYYALHVGSVNDWAGTNEIVSANGKNRFADLFFGSGDANILYLTDDENGDGIFVDNEFADLPEGIPEQQSRIARIDEIRAGSGDDIVDLTSQRYEYIGNGLTIHGGDGGDTIWANKGDNWLFGDAGNDRVVGASGNDVIAGGIGNDRMHGGGGGRHLHIL